MMKKLLFLSFLTLSINSTLYSMNRSITIIPINQLMKLQRDLAEANKKVAEQELLAAKQELLKRKLENQLEIEKLEEDLRQKNALENQKHEEDLRKIREEGEEDLRKIREEGEEDLRKIREKIKKTIEEEREALFFEKLSTGWKKLINKQEIPYELALAQEEIN